MTIEPMIAAKGKPFGTDTLAYQNYLNLHAQIPENSRDVVYRNHYMKYFVPRPKSYILDLGAYCGANLIHYGILGHRVEGVEGAERYVERFHEEMEGLPAILVEMHHCMIQDFQGENFDYVICGEVLEHAQRPQEIIQKAYECLRPGGKAFFCVLSHRMPTHLNEYTRDRLREEMGDFNHLWSVDLEHHFVCQGVK